MRSKRLSFILSTGIVIAMIGGMLFAPPVTAAFKYLQEGMKAPSVKGKDIITGVEISSDKYQADNIVVVFFWATWSGRSVQQLTDLKALFDKYKNSPVKFIAVNVEKQKITPVIRKEIEKTVAELNLPFPVIIDDGLKIFYEFGVIAVPSTAVFDSTGSLRYAPSGYSLSTRDYIVDTIEVLLGIKEPSIDSVLKEGYIPIKKASRYYYLALQLSNKRMYERALSNLEQAMEADSNFSAPHNLRGQIFLEIDSISAAIKEFEIAVLLDSSSIAARSGLARSFLRDGQVNSAFEKLTEIMTDDSTYTPAILDMALCLVEKRMTDEAIDFLLKAKELNPQDPMIYYYLGQVYLKSNQELKAVESFKEALEIIYPAQ